MKRLLAISVAFAALSGTAEAASIAFEGFNYSGTVTKYTSEADAVAGINGSSYAIPTSTNGANSTLPGARDAQVLADTDTGLFYLSTLWYYNPPEYSAQADGYGNLEQHQHRLPAALRRQRRERAEHELEQREQDVQRCGNGQQFKQPTRGSGPRRPTAAPRASRAGRS